MKYITLFILTLLIACKSEKKTDNSIEVVKQDTVKLNTLQTPDVLLGELFEKVQLNQIFNDGKTFVDCTAKYPYETIRKNYAEQKTNTDFDLKTFVLQHFDVPPSITSDFKSDPNHSASEHVEALWPILERKSDIENSGSTLITLPNPYIVPGGRFREVYYWDSYFTMLGLAESGKFDIITNMIDNFAHLINTVGHIPNGNRTYYITRSQPPFFSQMVALLAKYEGSYREDYELVQKMKGGTKTYKDLRAGAESGWDYSTRWFSDGKTMETIETTDIIPVDLNALLYGHEEVLLKCFSDDDSFTRKNKQMV